MVKRTPTLSPAQRRAQTAARDAKIIAACADLLPVLKTAQRLLRRKRLPPEELVRVVPGLAAWPDRHASTLSALDVATLIAGPGAISTTTTFAIVAQLHAVKPDKAERLYWTWQSRRPRARALATVA